MMTAQKKRNLIITIISVLMILITLYFGMSIHNANTNDHIEHLNVQDKLNYYPSEVVPALTIRAGIVTAPFVLAILVLAVIAALKSKRRQIKNLANGSVAAIFVVLVFDIITIVNPSGFDFSKWGMVWVAMGLIVIWTNVLSIFIKEN